MATNREEQNEIHCLENVSTKLMSGSPNNILGAELLLPGCKVEAGG